jgi:hypothetical protein
METRVQRGFGGSRWAIVWLVCAAAVFGQEVLDNDAVLKLVKAGVSESIILEIIKKQPGTYSFAADDVIRLKNAGVPDPIVAAMIERQTGTRGRLGLSTKLSPPNLTSGDAKTGETAAASRPFWNDTPIPQWSEEDAKQLLADSPWAKTVQLDMVRNLSMFERRDGGDLSAGIPTGFGLATAGLWADWREVEALEHAHALEGLGTVLVRWESAFPVRGAALKVGETDVPGWVGDYYAIAVHDVKLPFRWNIENQLKGVSYLKRDMRKDLKPFRVVVLPQADRLATVVYLFPRSAEIAKNGGSVEFVAQIGRLFVSANFVPEEMQVQGEPQL